MDSSELVFLSAIAARTAIVFVTLVAGIRLTGKRQTGEMNLHDLLLVLVLANAVQNAMTKGDGRVSVALISSGTLLLLAQLSLILMRSRNSWRAWLLGTPTVIVSGGRMLRRNMRREGVTENELMAAVRDQGIADVAQVKLAVLEIDGAISVIPQTHSQGS